MREVLRSLSEDVGRLEGLGRAQAQLYKRSISDFEGHRREMDILISQVNYLADEGVSFKFDGVSRELIVASTQIVREKRLGIAQL
jgi:hypothetical protein